MTKGLLISRIKKNELHKLYLIEPTANNRDCYVNYRNIYNGLIRLSKKLYFENNLAKHKKYPKKTWAVYNEAINNKKNSASIKEIFSGDKIISGEKEIAEEFNNFFSTVGEKHIQFNTKSKNKT